MNDHQAAKSLGHFDHARSLRALCLLLGFACACGAQQQQGTTAAGAQPSAAAIQVPNGRLPQGVTPLAYTLELNIVPNAERFSGRTQIGIKLDAPTKRIWLHGRNLHATSVKATLGQKSVVGSYTQLNDDGVVALDFAEELPAGNVFVEIAYDAALDKQLRGLYRVDAGGDSYAFTQFEAISARLAFPGFDEPRFKTPFELWLTVPEHDVAAANTSIVSEEAAANGMKRVRFATTKPLPTYLVAFAVGPLEIVDGPAIAPNALRSDAVPLRGIAIKGKGAQLAYALSEAGAMISALETYFGSRYPYDKLDLVAVPDFGAGAMENAGLVTFREWLLLLDKAHASEGQRRANAYVMAHELAHQWVGDLVTMRYWDDIWLNEAFATWMGERIVQQLHPEHRAELSTLGTTEDAMQNDSRVSARMIRQPIESSHDIMNAFDAITYSKGGGVLAMFERYLGAETFQKGVQAYLAAHAYGNASTDDLLDALSTAAGKDVKTPFSSFLTQVGVPLVAVELSCDPKTPNVPATLSLRQERFLPLGSAGSKAERWQIPVCVRYELAGKVHETCTLLTDTAGTLPLDPGGCPSWVMPNADAAGYYRYTMPSAELEKLRTHGLKKLTPRERLSLALTLHAGFESGSVPAKDVLAASRTWVADSERAVIDSPMGFLRLARNEIVPLDMKPAVERFVNELYSPVKSRLGFAQSKSDDGETKLLRAEVLGILADVGRDAATRKKLVKLGKQYLGIGGDNGVHADAVAADLADLATRITVEDGDEALFDALYQRFVKTDDVALRMRLLRALSSVRDTRAPKALALALDPQLHINEVMVPIREQLADPRTRDAAWQWFEQNFDAIVTRESTDNMGGAPWMSAYFCSSAMASRAQAFFEPRIAGFAGGPRSLAGALEALQLCAASVDAQRQSVIEFFDPKRAKAMQAAAPAPAPVAPAQAAAPPVPAASAPAQPSAAKPTTSAPPLTNPWGSSPAPATPTSAPTPAAAVTPAPQPTAATTPTTPTAPPQPTAAAPTPKAAAPAPATPAPKATPAPAPFPMPNAPPGAM